ncbi:hypothetical protein HG536_0E04710 [Torulaspora globosa]|uniref:Uncharacterized protein n=1 Tax=Torulaspora globosa TaxID=48254 RepID=A0A7G3ZJ74_9SACH|nr:uncharacterized protein HG536_0E04710 [Torulaspora globosa]QLL33560.1 hypothetical protein HG536_0E04710 [Torulaspora globosa]
MGALARVVSFCVAKDVNGRPALARLLLTRLISLYGVSTVLFLIKLRKLTSSSRWTAELWKYLRNSSGLAMALTLVPVIRALAGVENIVLPWSAAVGGALATVTGLPSWLSSYVAVESISDAVLSTRTVKKVLSNMGTSSLVIGRQALLCLLIPFFYSRADKQSSAAARFLFKKRSLGRDFVLFYCIWNFLSVYNSLKSFLRDSRREKVYRSQQYSSGQVDEWPMISSNLKPLMDKLVEIHEITLQDTYSSFEKIMNSPMIKNFMPCFKWALWRQLCVRTMTHTPPTRHNHAAGASLMKSITLMLGFFVLDGSDNKMNVRPGVLRYLIRCTLSTYLGITSLKTQQLIAFLGSHLALQNIAQ